LVPWNGRQLVSRHRRRNISAPCGRIGNKPGPRRHLVYGSIMASNAPFPSAPPSRASGAALHGRGARLWALVRGHPVRSGAVLGALLLIVVAGAPLATRAWEAFWSLPHAGRVVLCA